MSRVGVATERAREFGWADKWLDSAIAVLVFFEHGRVRALRAVGQRPDRCRANQKLPGLFQDLESGSMRIDRKGRPPFKEMFDEMQSPLPLTQAYLMREVLPLIRASNRAYKKSRQVHARPARPGEAITSRTADGDETTNTAGAGDMVVRNLTEAQEEYIVGQSGFLDRYSAIQPVDGTWTLYEPSGEVLAIEISRQLTAELGVGEEFCIVAPWGSEQLAREGDMFVSPLPDLDEVYRIARKEFEETYKIAGSGSR